MCFYERIIAEQTEQHLSNNTENIEGYPPHLLLTVSFQEIKICKMNR